MNLVSYLREYDKLATLFALGLFLGCVSQVNILDYRLKTIFAGVISIGISFLLREWG